MNATQCANGAITLSVAFSQICLQHQWRWLYRILYKSHKRTIAIADHSMFDRLY